MVTVHFKKKNKNDNFYYTYIKIYHNGKTKLISLKMRFPLDEVNWSSSSSKKDRLKRLRDNGFFINEKNDKHDSLNKEIQRKLSFYQKNYNQKLDDRSFISYTENYIEKLQTNKKHGTQNLYVGFKNYLLEFLNKKGKSNLYFDEITKELIRDFQLFLKNKGISNSTNNNNLYKFRKLYELSMDEDYHTPLKNIFTRFEYQKTKTSEKESLSINQVHELLYSRPLKNDKRGHYIHFDEHGYETIQPVEKSKLIFTFQIFSGGLRVSDILFLQWGDLDFSEDEMSFKFNTFKTNDTCFIKITPTMIWVLRHFVNKEDIYTTFFPPNTHCVRCGSTKLKKNGWYSHSKEKKRLVLKCEDCKRNFGITKKEIFRDYFKQWKPEDFKYTSVETESIYPCHVIDEIKTIKSELDKYEKLHKIGLELLKRDEKDIDRLRIHYSTNEEYQNLFNDPYFYNDKVEKLRKEYKDGGLKHWWRKFEEDQYKHYVEIFKKYKNEYPNRFVFQMLKEEDFPSLKKGMVDRHFKEFLTKEQYTKYQNMSKRHNGLLKKVSQKMGFDINLTTHTSRHTFTRIGLSKNMSVYSLQKLLQHKSVSTTQKYLGSFDKDIVFKEVDEKFHDEFRL